MALLPPFADSVRMSAMLSSDAHPSFFPNAVDMSETEDSSHVTLTFLSSGPQEVFQKPILDVVEVNTPTESQEESPLPPLRRKRPIRRYAECSSGDEYLPKSVRRRSHVSYRESDSSSEGESDCGHPALSSNQEGSQKLKLVLEILSQSKTIETMLHVGCRIRSLEAIAASPELPLGVLRGCPSCPNCQKVVATWRPDAGRRPCIDEAPVFYPNEEEFEHPLEYLSSIRTRAEPYGICRVVPPQSWRPPCPLLENSPELQSMLFPTRVQQVHKLQVREPSAKEYSPTKQANKKRRGRASLGRMGGSAMCPTEDDNREYFGFEPGDPFPLRGFEKYANDFKDQYFRISDQQSSEADRKWEPTVEMIEGEYWRIVEQATDQIEVLYGADVETGKFGSGFPKAPPGTEAASAYEKSGWNLNNIARYPGSMLSFEEGDISGHVEDHHFYSLNYMHWGAPKVWYGVPGSAADKLEAAMKKHLPDLFAEQPDLLHKLVTQLSPSFLKEEGVPVYRLVQQAGDFVITFPHAYHSGFNSGFNVAEAVNVAPVDWLPHGQAAVELYRELHRKTSVSHDKLLLGAARVAVKMWWHSQQNENFHLMKDAPWMAQLQTEDNRHGTLNVKRNGLEPGLVWAWQAYCGEGGVLAKALKERVDMERAWRESIRIVAGEAFPLSMKQMDSTYDSTDERECELCKYDLHLSAIGCQCCPDIFSCLLHGHLLCSCPWSRKTLLYRYNLDQLGLLLAAVEGRPGAVGDWTKQDSQLPASSPCSCQGGVLPMHVRNEQQKDVEPIQASHGCQTSRGLGFVPTIVKEEVVRQIGNVALWAGSLLQSDSDIPATPSSLLAGIIPNKVAASSGKKGDSNAKDASPNQQGFEEALSVSQRVILTRSGHAKAVTSPNMTIQLDTIETSQWQRGDRNLSAMIHPISPTFEIQLPSLSACEVILLSDDEEDEKIPGKTCKLNEASEASAESSEAGTRFTATAAVINPEKVQEGQVQLPVSLVDVKRDNGGTSPNILPLQLGGGGSAEEMVSVDTLSVSSQVASVGAGSQKGPLRNYTGSPPSQESPLHAHPCPIRPLRLETVRPDEPAACPRPMTNVVTVVQRNTSNSWAGPRVARVRMKREVELLDTGHIVMREGWHTRQAIYPAEERKWAQMVSSGQGTILIGFRSQTRFIDVEDVFQTCMYISEILDCGPGARPLFKVTHPTKREVFLNESIDECWCEIQNQVNELIIARRSEDSSRQLPPLLPPPSGLEMFGLTLTSIIQAVEALDPSHQCSEYWRGKHSVVKQDTVQGFLDNKISVSGKSQAYEKQTQEPCLWPLPDRAAENLMVNTSGRLHMNNGNGKVTSSKLSNGMGSPVRRGILTNSGQRERQDSYLILQGLFQKANAEELRVLYRLFTSETQGAEWNSAFRALTNEVQKRIV